METLLRKYLWVIDLVVIALSAMFGARATATIIESSLTRGLPPPAKRAARPVGSTMPTVYTKQTEEILKRNMFCSTCPPILGGKDPPPQAIDLTPQRTTLPLRLLAIMFAPAPVDPRWSMAIIRDNDEKSAGPYAIGSTIREATITDIEETRVDLDVHGRKEYLELIDKGGPTAPGAAPAAAAPAAPASDPLMAEMEKGVKKINENTYDVQRGTVDSLLGNMSVLSRAARIVPEIKDGKPAGFRLFSVRPDGPFAKIGFQNGDVISSINGLDMSSPDKALEVYTKLRSASHLSVAMERNGAKVTKEYSIR
ncbi:MAG TPA: type II secretion system protein GspC [Polyangia bacterium]|nr:type II secretion system protein GspC [Polyangia bacterium]